MGRTLSSRALRTLRDMRAELKEREVPTPSRRVSDNPIELHVGKITSTTTTSGRYPGLRWERTNGAATPTYTATDEVIWIEPTNSETLAVGTLYNLKLVDEHSDGKLVYRAVGVSGSAAYARVNNTGTSTTVPLVGNATVTWTTEESDTSGYWDPANPSVLTVPAGVFEFTANLQVNGSPGSRALFWIATPGGFSRVALTSLAWVTVGAGLNYDLYASMSSGPVVTSISTSFSVLCTVSGFSASVDGSTFSVKSLS